MSDLLMLMAHKQYYVAVMFNKRGYSSDIAAFDMLTVILYNIFKTTTVTIALVEAAVNERL